MKLPILISVSVAPGSYFPCAVAGGEARAETRSAAAENRSVVIRSSFKQLFYSSVRVPDDGGQRSFVGAKVLGVFLGRRPVRDLLKINIVTGTVGGHIDIPFP